jgi:haloalkane dehalogenase
VRGFNAFSAIAARVCCTRRKLPAEVRQAYTAPYDSWAHRIATLRFVQDIPLRPGDPSYEIVSNVEKNAGQFSRIPMIVFWGLRDFVFDRHFLKLWEERFPAAEFHRFEDCGHYVLEDARDEIIPRVRAFLDRT